jgi:hypothetical protein
MLLLNSNYQKVSLSIHVNSQQYCKKRITYFADIFFPSVVTTPEHLKINKMNIEYNT